MKYSKTLCAYVRHCVLVAEGVSAQLDIYGNKINDLQNGSHYVHKGVYNHE